MIKICISGFTSTGKTTLGELLSKSLNIPHINASYKDVVGDGDALIDLQRKADKAFAQKFDREIISKAKGKDCVITTWLSPWLIKDATVRVWLSADKDERANRTAKRNGVTRAKAMKYLEEKDSTTMRNFKRDYGIDILEHSLFDIELNSSRMSIDEMAAIVSLIALSKDVRNKR